MPSSPATVALDSLNIPFVTLPDGTIYVPGDIDLSFKGLTALPPLHNVHAGSNFFCQGNQLTTLDGAPQQVDGDFHCDNNRLHTLEGAPSTLGGYLYCYNNHLISLKGAPAIINGDFWCNSNYLQTLSGGPKTVKGLFTCAHNALLSLHGAPTDIGGDFDCSSNLLTSMLGSPYTIGGAIHCYDNCLHSFEGLNKSFSVLFSDLGTFNDANNIPAHLLPAPPSAHATNRDLLLSPSPAIQKRHRPRIQQ